MCSNVFKCSKCEFFSKLFIWFFVVIPYVTWCHAVWCSPVKVDIHAWGIHQLTRCSLVTQYPFSVKFTTIFIFMISQLKPHIQIFYVGRAIYSSIDYVVNLLSNITHSCWCSCYNIVACSHLLTHWGWDKMATIFQTTFSNAFPWMKMYDFWLKFHWSLFIRVQLTIPALVQIMTWRRPGDKPLCGPMMVRLPMHICVTGPQWVNTFRPEKITKNLSTAFQM